MSQSTVLPDVLTLEEAAAYLRLPQELVTREAMQGHLPGRQVDNSWRFLKTAIDDWLKTKNTRSILLQQAGVFADDETLTTLRAEIYTARQRSEVS
ncbi:MAG: helix-turn-helix domain-containing protein [Trueperaceae bacterium]